MNLNKPAIMIIGILMLLSAVGGYYLSPVKTVEVEKEVERERVKILTVVKEHKNPDGSADSTTTITEDRTRKTETDKTKVTTPERPKDWFVTIQTSSFSHLETVGGSVNRRILGPLFLGVNGTYNFDNNNHQVLFDLGYEF